LLGGGRFVLPRLDLLAGDLLRLDRVLVRWLDRGRLIS
jgi:hypothetical protein